MIGAPILSFLLLLTAAPRAEARVISEAERAAVEIAAAYLSGGPAAIAERVSPQSPLQRGGPQGLLEEIEVRLGPPAGASWEMQTVVPALADRAAAFSISFPSGVDETAVFDLVREGERALIQDIRILAQPAARPTLFAAAGIRASETPREAGTARAAVAGLLGASLCVTALFLRRSQPGLSKGLLGGALALAVVGVAVELPRGALIKAPLKTVSAPAAQQPDRSLAPLLPLRRAMAAGNLELPIARCTNHICADIASLWHAQVDLQQMRTASAKSTLLRFKAPSSIPLAEILRGRLALFENDAVAAAMSYENAVNLGPGRDALWYETAQALMALGFEERASRYLRRLERVGSREAAVYYALSMLSVRDNKEDQAESYLHSAYKMQPVERAALVEAQAFWSILRKESTRALISLNAPEESAVTSPSASTRSIEFPAGADIRLSGDLLAARFGEQELLVAGGAALAPPGSPVTDAASWARSEEERGLRDFEQLRGTSRNAAAFAQPALRRRFARVTNALASRNRWNDIATLTDGLTPRSEHVPAQMFLARGTALQRLGQRQEARQLFEQLAQSSVLLRQRDADALEDLAEGLAALDNYDAAIKMLDRANAIRPNPMADDRVRQLQMNKRLATRYAVKKTPHFEIRYPADVSEDAASDIAGILEAEYKRLQKWIPTPNFRPVAVNILWWQDFRSTYTGTDFILGFYQAEKITVPFAGVPQYIPEVVALLTHELCHAMLAQATNDQAPRWFQEGLAQRVEMREYMANAFNMYEEDKLLAVSLLDSVMRGSPDPEMISEAYIESQTIIRFIEARYGTQAVSRLIEAFRSGAGTEEAIRLLTGKAVAEFDRELREWGRGGARVFQDPPPIRYDGEAGGMQWTRGAGR